MAYRTFVEKCGITDRPKKLHKTTIWHNRYVSRQRCGKTDKWQNKTTAQLATQMGDKSYWGKKLTNGKYDKRKKLTIETMTNGKKLTN